MLFCCSDWRENHENKEFLGWSQRDIMWLTSHQDDLAVLWQTFSMSGLNVCLANKDLTHICCLESFTWVYNPRLFYYPVKSNSQMTNWVSFVGYGYRGSAMICTALKKCYFTEEDVWPFTHDRKSAGTKFTNTGMYAPLPNSQRPWVNWIVLFEWIYQENQAK